MRPFTEQESAVIGAILAGDFPGAGELRAQLEVARVTRHWGSGESPSIDLEVPATTPAAPIAEPVLPVDAHVLDDRGEYVGELIVWLSRGRLAALEYATITGEAPRSLPEPSTLRLIPR
jgi:hypothetical protein